MCLAASSTVWTGYCMGSPAERRLMKALAGCSNKEQIIISGHCPSPNSLQHPPPLLPHLLTPRLKMLICAIAGRPRKAEYTSRFKREPMKKINKAADEGSAEKGEAANNNSQTNQQLLLAVASSYTPFPSLLTNSLPPVDSIHPARFI